MNVRACGFCIVLNVYRFVLQLSRNAKDWCFALVDLWVIHNHDCIGATIPPGIFWNHFYTFEMHYCHCFNITVLSKGVEYLKQLYSFTEQQSKTKDCETRILWDKLAFVQGPFLRSRCASYSLWQQLKVKANKYLSQRHGHWQQSWREQTGQPLLITAGRRRKQWTRHKIRDWGSDKGRPSIGINSKRNEEKV